MTPKPPAVPAPGADPYGEVADELRAQGYVFIPSPHPGWWASRREQELMLLLNDDEYSPEHQDEYQRLWHRDARRAEAAESEIARLTESREKERRLVDEWTGEAATQRERAEAAEAEVARLRDGLREAKWLIGAGLPHTMEWHDRADAWYTAARALLDEDGAATPSFNQIDLYTGRPLDDHGNYATEDGAS